MIGICTMFPLLFYILSLKSSFREINDKTESLYSPVGPIEYDEEVIATMIEVMETYDFSQFESKNGTDSSFSHQNNKIGYFLERDGIISTDQINESSSQDTYFQNNGVNIESDGIEAQVMGSSDGHKTARSIDKSYHQQGTDISSSSPQHYSGYYFEKDLNFSQNTQTTHSQLFPVPLDQPTVGMTEHIKMNSKQPQLYPVPLEQPIVEIAQDIHTKDIPNEWSFMFGHQNGFEHYNTSYHQPRNIETAPACLNFTSDSNRFDTISYKIKVNESSRINNLSVQSYGPQPISGSEIINTHGFENLSPSNLINEGVKITDQTRELPFNPNYRKTIGDFLEDIRNPKIKMSVINQKNGFKDRNTSLCNNKRQISNSENQNHNKDSFENLQKETRDHSPTSNHITEEGLDHFSYANNERYLSINQDLNQTCRDDRKVDDRTVVGNDLESRSGICASLDDTSRDGLRFNHRNNSIDAQGHFWGNQISEMSLQNQNLLDLDVRNQDTENLLNTGQPSSTNYSLPSPFLASLHEQGSSNKSNCPLPSSFTASLHEQDSSNSTNYSLPSPFTASLHIQGSSGSSNRPLPSLYTIAPNERGTFDSSESPSKSSLLQTSDTTNIDAMGTFNVCDMMRQSHNTNFYESSGQQTQLLGSLNYQTFNTCLGVTPQNQNSSDPHQTYFSYRTASSDSLNRSGPLKIQIVNANDQRKLAALFNDRIRSLFYKQESESPENATASPINHHSLSKQSQTKNDSKKNSEKSQEDELFIIDTSDLPRNTEEAIYRLSFEQNQKQTSLFILDRNGKFAIETLKSNLASEDELNNLLNNFLELFKIKSFFTFKMTINTKDKFLQKYLNRNQKSSISTKSLLLNEFKEKHFIFINDRVPKRVSDNNLYDLFSVDVLCSSNSQKISICNLFINEISCLVERITPETEFIDNLEITIDFIRVCSRLINILTKRGLFEIQREESRYCKQDNCSLNRNIRKIISKNGSNAIFESYRCIFFHNIENRHPVLLTNRFLLHVYFRLIFEKQSFVEKLQEKPLNNDFANEFSLLVRIILKKNSIKPQNGGLLCTETLMIQELREILKLEIQGRSRSPLSQKELSVLKR